MAVARPLPPPAVDPEATTAWPGLGAWQERLQRWVRDTLGDVEVVQAPPGAVAERPVPRRVQLHLHELQPAPAVRGPRGMPLRFAARCLVCTDGPDPAVAADDLGRLVFAALDTPGWEVDFDAPAPACWSAWGTAPRPTFGLRAVMQRERPKVAVPTVRAPLTLTPSAVVRLQGIVVGPNELPLANARVELQALGRVALTGPDGRFVLDGVPVGGPLRVQVRARGAVQAYEIDSGGDGTPVMLRMALR